jgi:hypothetical protein
MLNSNAAKRAVWIIGAALFVVGSTAFAHTTIRSQVTESTTDDNAIKIGHGSETPDGSAHRPWLPQCRVPFRHAGSHGIGRVDDRRLERVIEQGTIAGEPSDRSIFDPTG